MFPFEQFSLEMLVVFAIGLMVLGPKDLPVVMRKLGQFVAKMRGMAAEFRASFDELARQSELDELRKEVEALRTGAYSSPAPAADPVHDYKPFDDAASGLDSTGFSFPPQPSTTRPPIMAEGLPPADAEVPLAKAPTRKSRTRTPEKNPPPPAADTEPEAVVEAAPLKPARKPRVRKPAPAEESAARDAAE
jgi:sec-independent protein translocase protein TatB